ncbi:MAG: DUF3892 domain-containing protein [Candidatus Onthomonas sp.]
MLATKVKMKPGCSQSTRLEDIQALYITGGVRAGYFHVNDLWDYLDYNPGYIQVNVRGYPNLVAVGQGERRHLKSTLSPKGIDYLFSLPRE